MSPCSLLSARQTHAANGLPSATALTLAPVAAAGTTLSFTASAWAWVRMLTSLYQEGLQGTIKKVLLTGGPKEVKRTWGVGFKALMAEISGKGVQ